MFLKGTSSSVTLPSSISFLTMRGVIFSPALQITSPVAASIRSKAGRVPDTRRGKNLVTHPWAFLS